jgi:hypothetical protein
MTDHFAWEMKLSKDVSQFSGWIEEAVIDLSSVECDLADGKAIFEVDIYNYGTAQSRPWSLKLCRTPARRYRVEIRNLVAFRNDTDKDCVELLVSRVKANGRLLQIDGTAGAFSAEGEGVTVRADRLNDPLLEHVNWFIFGWYRRRKSMPNTDGEHVPMQKNPQTV